VRTRSSLEGQILPVPFPKEFRRDVIAFARQGAVDRGDTPTGAAIAVLDNPSAASSTIRARCASPARADDLVASLNHVF
jgi:hypothetical protein